MADLNKEYDLPLKYDLFLYRGDDYAKGVRIKDEATGTYFDLSGCVPSAQVRETVVSDVPLFEFSVGLADQSDPNTKGLVYLQVPENVWHTLPIFQDPTQIGVYDFQLEFPSSKTVTYIYGDLYLKGDTSR